MKIRYTIIIEEEEELENWKASSNEEMLENIKEYIAEDAGYLSDSHWKEIKVEEIK